MQVLSIDFVHHRTRVDVRYRTDRGPLPAPHKKHEDKAKPVEVVDAAGEPGPMATRTPGPTPAPAEAAEPTEAAEATEIPGLQPPDML